MQKLDAVFTDRIPIMIELGFDPKSIPKLKEYLELLWASNEDLNLISRKMTPEELMDNHVIDCLLPLKRFPKGIELVADFGSGGGLPGVMYAIQFPEMQFHLFEKSVKKQEFLTRCKKIAPNIEIEAEIPLDLAGIDLIIARAFKPLDVILDISRKYLESGGKYFLLKGRLEKIEEEIAISKKKFKDLRVTIEPLRSPVLEVERHLVFI